MKGKNQFNTVELKEIRDLIRRRVTAPSNEQKSIRRKMRLLGFYGHDDFGIKNCQESDLERLISEKRIIITDKKAASQATAKESHQNGPAESTWTIPVQNTSISKVEKQLIQGRFISVNALYAARVPHEPGLYCIKLQAGVTLPSKFGKAREDGIIYIGKTSKSLYERLWEEELNHKRPATFFRSIGAILGYLPPKGSLAGKSTRNYKFNKEDTELIRQWIQQSLLVNFVTLERDEIDEAEKSFIKKYCPLVNIQHNPKANGELKAARDNCVAYANSK